MKHVAFVFYASDYRDASRRRASGLAELYRHHGYSLGCMERLRDSGHLVSVVRMHGAETFDEEDHAHIRYVGLAAEDANEGAALLHRFANRNGVTHIVILFPSHEIIDAASATGAEVAVVLADSFPKSLRSRRRYVRLSRSLSDSRVTLIANHQVNSARNLAKQLGMSLSAVVPWDWPLDLASLAESVAGDQRTHQRGAGIRLCYAGSINKSKGVWDLLHAVVLLRLRGLNPSLQLAGGGDLKGLHRRIRHLRLDGRVEHLGVVGGDEVIAMMRRSDFVVVPSRHSYPEGRPLTIYEAMASGTPLVASDHPMFAGVVTPEATGFVFKAGWPVALASAVGRAWRNPELYSKVARSAGATYPHLGARPLWGELIMRWVRGTVEDRKWIEEQSLGAHST